MLYTIKLKLTSHILGEKRVSGIRRLNKVGDQIIIDGDLWANKLFQSACDLGLIYDKSVIRFDESYRSPSIHLYRRVYKKTRIEMFESIRKGTVITMDLLIDNTNTYSLTSEEYTKMFNHMGKYYGITEWGEKFGYGRFYILNFEPKFRPANGN